MKLYLLRPVKKLEHNNNPWHPWFDKAFGFVVRAETEAQARELANKDGGDETGGVNHSVYRTGGDPWLDEEFSTCIELTPDGELGVIIKDFASA